MNGHFVRFWNTIYISRSVKAFELRIETGKIAFQQMPGLVADIACKKITVNISGVIPFHGLLIYIVHIRPDTGRRFIQYTIHIDPNFAIIRIILAIVKDTTRKETAVDSLVNVPARPISRPYFYDGKVKYSFGLPLHLEIALQVQSQGGQIDVAMQIIYGINACGRGNPIDRQHEDISLRKGKPCRRTTFPIARIQARTVKRASFADRIDYRNPLVALQHRDIFMTDLKDWVGIAYVRVVGIDYAYQRLIRLPPNRI